MDKFGDGFVPSAEQYTGFFMLSRKNCGADFMEHMLNGNVGVDIFDYEGEFVTQYTYFRDDASTSSITVQFVRNNVPETSLGNAGKKDQFYVEFSGLDVVSFGAKDVEECLAGAQVGI